VSQPVAAYADPGASFIYNLLFADDPEPFRPAAEGRLAALFADPADVEALTAIATDASVESRMRVLAHRRLREAGAADPDPPLLGVIVEVGLEDGTDTLAAFADGGVRYINQGGGMSAIETRELVAGAVGELLAAAAALVPAVDEAAEARGEPPPNGRLRVTLLVGDRRKVAGGEFEQLGRDPLAGPVVTAALGLLGQVMALREMGAA
jgi:hypothetical protein